MPDLTRDRLAVAHLILEHAARPRVVPHAGVVPVVRVPVDLFLDLPDWLQEQGEREQRDVRSPAVYTAPIEALALYALGQGPA